MAEEKYLKKVDAFITPYLEKQGFVLLKSEFVSESGLWYLRIYIDLTDEEREKRAAMPAQSELTQEESDNMLIRETTYEGLSESEQPPSPEIGINDCAAVSRYLSKWLDKEDFIREAYTLEVCSKGFLE